MSGETIDTCELNHKFWHDGTNGQDLVDAIGAGAAAGSYSGTTYTFTLNSDVFVVPADRWFTWYFGGEYNGTRGIFTTAEVDLRQKAIPVIPELATREGYGNIAAKVTAATQNVVVTLDTAMSNTSYKPCVQLLGAPGIAGIGGHGITGWTVDSATQVTVHLSSAALSVAVTDGVYVAATELV